MNQNVVLRIVSTRSRIVIFFQSFEVEKVATYVKEHYFKSNLHGKPRNLKIFPELVVATI
jgi:hypothetical protein